MGIEIPIVGPRKKEWEITKEGGQDKSWWIKGK